MDKNLVLLGVSDMIVLKGGYNIRFLLFSNGRDDKQQYQMRINLQAQEFSKTHTSKRLWNTYLALSLLGNQPCEGKLDIIFNIAMLSSHGRVLNRFQVIANGIIHVT